MAYDLDATLAPNEKQDINYLLAFFYWIVEQMRDVQNSMDNFDISDHEESYCIVRDEFEEMLNEGGTISNGRYRTVEEYKLMDNTCYRESLNNYVDSVQRDPQRLQQFPEYEALIERHSELEEKYEELFEAIEETPFGKVSFFDRLSKTWNGGTLIEGTLKDKEILEAILEAMVNTPEYEQLMMSSTCVNWLEPFSDPTITTEQAAEFTDEMFSRMETYAPEGFYFGMHPDDGADLGYWPVMDDFKPATDYPKLMVKGTAHVPQRFWQRKRVHTPEEEAEYRKYGFIVSSQN